MYAAEFKIAVFRDLTEDYKIMRAETRILLEKIVESQSTVRLWSYCYVVNIVAHYIYFTILHLGGPSNFCNAPLLGTHGSSTRDYKYKALLSSLVPNLAYKRMILGNRDSILVHRKYEKLKDSR